VRPVFKPAITQYNNDDYEVLRTYLFRTLGPYCSYCEAPISNDSAVEHKVPKNTKKGFPAQATEWRNLLIACQSCNSAKGTRPYALKTYTATSAAWVWPDKTAPMPNQPSLPEDESYLSFGFSDNSYSQVELADLELVRLEDGKTKPWANAKHSMLWVVPSSSISDAVRTRVLATIQGLNLNFYNSDNQSYNDRRVINRLAAFNSAHSALTNLENVFEHHGRDINAAGVTYIIQAIRHTIVASGFFSVWFRVFRKSLSNPAAGSYWYNIPVADRLFLFEALLLYYFPEESPTGARRLIFPGTDVDRLDMNSFV
jgi:hypothetical protein